MLVGGSAGRGSGGEMCFYVEAICSIERREPASMWHVMIEDVVQHYIIIYNALLYIHIIDEARYYVSQSIKVP